MGEVGGKGEGVIPGKRNRERAVPVSGDVGAAAGREFQIVQREAGADDEGVGKSVPGNWEERTSPSARDSKSTVV